MWSRNDYSRDSSNTHKFSSGLGPRLCWLLVHALCVGLLIGVDKGFQHQIASHTCYAILYLLVLLLTVVQYYYTAGSAPGYVVDLEADPEFEAGIKGVVNSTPCSRCSFCRVLQPLRTKHCHDCDKCVLKFDHHCVWLGTCIGQFNHRRFWWYVFLETVLCIWTTIIYFQAFRSRNARIWVQNVFLLVVFVGLLCCSIFLATLLIFHSYLVITNQTTYEKTRRKRISYLRNLPANVHPFSRGVVKNVSDFCCSSGKGYRFYELPDAES